MIAILNPETDKLPEDLIPAIESMEFLSDEDKRMIFRENAI